MLQPGPTTPGKHRDSGPEWSAIRNGHSPGKPDNRRLEIHRERFPVTCARTPLIVHLDTWRGRVPEKRDFGRLCRALSQTGISGRALFAIMTGVCWLCLRLGFSPCATHSVYSSYVVGHMPGASCGEDSRRAATGSFLVPTWVQAGQHANPSHDCSGLRRLG